uniref:guanosine-3',5'-bis(diphosphate) 3'-diphosphatase n=1 Tax=Candidatus Kentrum sp. MB TaxID=2138164 RepID=A0A450XAN0_9GAMM|nr:MAG: GTP pyrophosphokinase/guanosine-3',5'-bis(diphosphate) 3'-pyrophosphohydrolase [Candidatus Kentron sp. MB]VFK32405.1 MAG: GTP pyrophosphokinase/guanosine-3',5'-bis(diphosphate) 3'-pyrophosphohydrolase [Candidatus Kentron sp. MB]VFK75896.1 MAG: GTP pyrophosphokinase/guanosine-3',5'-bis(diphosphate) 3'-pyrophosphohydrolase [Candidatus Kentron sp. MB]
MFGSFSPKIPFSKEFLRGLRVPYRFGGSYRWDDSLPEYLSEQTSERRYYISELCELTEQYLEPVFVREIYRSYLFSAEAHDGQKRSTGEPYIFHPLHVAKILAEMHLDYQTIIAAILHDVIEDTPMAHAHVAKAFGSDVAELVDGVSKLTHVKFDSLAERQAENFRKMLLAMTKDIRVILIKLADRLHNMRTLDGLASEKRFRIARETLDIYAPIASRLGLSNIAIELEEYGFKALYPMRYRVLAGKVKTTRGNRRRLINRIERKILNRLQEDRIQCRVSGREKHLYSLYRKMRHKHRSFSEVLDIYAFRIIVDEVDTCYRVLGVIHGLYKPVPGRFKDYIAIPKANAYQSLHTVLWGPHGIPIEIQIRTEEMHAVAETGIATHCRYKNDATVTNAAHQRAREWLRGLSEMQKKAGNPVELLESVKVDLFPDEVYVFTPAGDIMALPRGATAVDFAYAVHTGVGDTCVAVKIDQLYASLRTPLENGQTVEVLTAPWAHPNPSWLLFVVTAKAQSNIRNYLKRLREDQIINLGQRMLTQPFAQRSAHLNDIPKKRMDALLSELGIDDQDTLLMEIGLGKRAAASVAHKLLDDTDLKGTSISERADDFQFHYPLHIKGTEGMVVALSKCCYPIPGDSIVGVSTGRGVVIHTRGCKNVSVDHVRNVNKLVNVEWEHGIKGEFPVRIRIHALNRKGALAAFATAIAEMGANIENIVIFDRDGAHSSVGFIIDINDRHHLARIIKRLRAIDFVSRITRT